MNDHVPDPGQSNWQSQFNDFLQSLGMDASHTPQHLDPSLPQNHLPDYSQPQNLVDHSISQPGVLPDFSQTGWVDHAQSYHLPDPHHDWNQTSGVDQHHLHQHQRQQEEAERQRREEEASKGKEFTFEIITVDKNGKENSKKSGKGYQKDEDLGNGIKLEMVYIPAGNFMMGSPSGEGRDNERPQHPVTIAQPFYMGKYPVTQEQYQAVMGNNPSNFKGAKLPVENVSWNEAVNFCQKLSEKTGKKYSLPSESQWEYACRAGTTTPFHFGETITPDLVNYDGNNPYGAAPKGLYRQETTPVGSFTPNAFGLYDMHGNVWEWCADPWHGNYQGATQDGSVWDENNNDNRYHEYDVLVNIKNDNRSRLLRGGSWDSGAGYCRAAYRSYDSPDYRNNDIGFRVVCSGAWLP